MSNRAVTEGGQIKLIVHGAAGRMGRQIIAAASNAADLHVVAAVGRPDSVGLGQDAGILAGGKASGVLVTDDLGGALELGGVVIDVSTPTAAVGLVGKVASRGTPTVVATTGLSASDLAAIREAASSAPILVAPNLSVGINLLTEVLPIVVRALGPDYDIEIVEAHHRFKKDAPSGTAIRLAEAIAAALGRPLAELERDGRHGIMPRETGEIGVHAVRAGGIVGEHHVIFANEGEQIEISHRAFSRETFARGALRAARFLANQEPGFYTMQDVLSQS